MKFFLLYILLLFIRFALHINTQTGYIHPDEFFQTIEISAGDVLKFQTNLPWEFTITPPVRSRAIIELFLSFPLKVYLKFREFLGLKEAKYYNLLRIFRIWTTVCSLIVDFSVFKLSKFSRINARQSLLLHATSSVIMVFLSRSFSNTWETQLMAILTILVLDVRPKMQWYRSMSIGVVGALGLFCRPTFVAFAIPFVINRSFLSMNFLSIYRLMTVAIGFVITTATVIAYDTLRLETERLYEHSYNIFDVIDQLAIAPLSFIRYNSDTTTIAAAHGRHPRWTHVVVNLFLLLGPVYLLCAALILQMLWRTLKNQWWVSGAEIDGSGSKSIWRIVAAVVVPVLCLSVFPHQEARFLLPTWPPLVVLASAALGSCDGNCACQIYKSKCRRSNRWHFMMLAHLLFHILSILFWGYLHEGGLMRSTELMRHSIHDNYNNCLKNRCDVRYRNPVEHVIVSYKCLLLPLFPLEIPAVSNMDPVTLVNMMGCSEHVFWSRLQTLLSHSRLNQSVCSSNRRSTSTLLHLVFPKAFVFREPKLLQQLGTIMTVSTILGHINTDLMPPQVPLLDFVSLQYVAIAVN